MDRHESQEVLERTFESMNSFASVWENFPMKPRRIRSFWKEVDNQSIISTTIIAQEQIIEYRNIFIGTLHSEDYVLRKPIPVSIEHEEQVYVASNYDLGLYGYGDTENEAIDDLRESIIGCYEDLKQEKELGPIPSRMMAYYEEIIDER